MLTKNRKFFLILLATYAIISQSFILLTNKGSEIVYFCYTRQNMVTEFFKIATQLGESIGLVCIALYLILKNRVALIAAVLSFIPINLFLQFLKKTLNFPRPLLYFKNGEISPIPDFKALYYHSMPSGHTFTAFFCMTFLIFYFDLNRSWQIILFILALLVGISRIYLMCHFKEDVFIGSILGIIAGILSMVIYEKGLKKV